MESNLPVVAELGVAPHRTSELGRGVVGPSTMGRIDLTMIRQFIVHRSRPSRVTQDAFSHASK